MTKLVSILSYGHSGSTLLDILAGTIPGVFSTGECVWFPWQLYRNGGVCELGQDVCSCGEKFSKCKTWVSIVTALSQKVGYDIYRDPFRFKIAMLKNQAYDEKLDLTERLLRASCFRFMSCYYPFLIRKAFSHYVRKEVNNNWLLFDTIGETLGLGYIVDSSKDIMRMKFLHEKRPNDVYAVLLLRDILGVSASAAKRGEDPVAAAKNWIDLYKQTLRILKKTNSLKLLVVRYEELAEYPQKTRDNLAKFVGLKSPGDLVTINTREHHLVAGNSMRYKGNISIIYDNSWEKVLAADIKDKIIKIQSDFAPMLKEFQKIMSISQKQ